MSYRITVSSGNYTDVNDLYSEKNVNMPTISNDSFTNIESTVEVASIDDLFTPPTKSDSVSSTIFSTSDSNSFSSQNNNSSMPDSLPQTSNETIEITDFQKNSNTENSTTINLPNNASSNITSQRDRQSANPSLSETLNKANDFHSSTNKGTLFDDLSSNSTTGEFDTSNNSEGLTSTQNSQPNTTGVSNNSSNDMSISMDENSNPNYSGTSTGSMPNSASNSNSTSDNESVGNFEMDNTSMDEGEGNQTSEETLTSDSSPSHDEDYVFTSTTDVEEESTSEEESGPSIMELTIDSIDDDVIYVSDNDGLHYTIPKEEFFEILTGLNFSEEQIEAVISQNSTILDEFVKILKEEGYGDEEIKILTSPTASEEEKLYVQYHHMGLTDEEINGLISGELTWDELITNRTRSMYEANGFTESEINALMSDDVDEATKNQILYNHYQLEDWEIELIESEDNNFTLEKVLELRFETAKARQGYTKEEIEKLKSPSTPADEIIILQYLMSGVFTKEEIEKIRSEEMSKEDIIKTLYSRLGYTEEDINRLINNEITMEDLNTEIMNDDNPERLEKLKNAQEFFQIKQDINNQSTEKLPSLEEKISDIDHQIENLKNEREELVNKGKTSPLSAADTKRLNDIAKAMEDLELQKGEIQNQIDIINEEIDFLSDVTSYDDLVAKSQEYDDLVGEQSDLGQAVLDTGKVSETGSMTWDWEALKAARGDLGKFNEKNDAQIDSNSRVIQIMKGLVDQIKNDSSEQSYEINFFASVDQEDFLANCNYRGVSDDILETINQKYGQPVTIEVADGEKTNAGVLLIDDKDLEASLLYKMLNGDIQFNESGYFVDKNGNQYPSINSSDDLIRHYSEWISRNQESGNIVSENQIKIFNYKYNTEGTEAALEYLETIAPFLDNRNVQQRRIADEAFADQHGFWSSLGSVILGPKEGIDAFIYSTMAVNSDDAILRSDTYSTSDVWRAKVTNNIAKTYGEGWAFLYGTGMSMLDSAEMIGLTVLLGGNPAAMAVLSPVLMGSRVYISTLNDALDRGLSDTQAVQLAFSASVVESLMEAYSVGHLLNLESHVSVGLLDLINRKVPDPRMQDLMRAFAGIISQSLAEGEEELCTDIVNALCDQVISGDMSEFSSSIDDYMSKGLSYEEAFTKSFGDMSDQWKMSFLGGVLSGIGFGGVSSLGSLTYNTSHKTAIQMAQEMGLDLNNPTTQEFINKQAGLLADQAYGHKIDMAEANENKSFKDQWNDYKLARDIKSAKRSDFLDNLFNGKIKISDFLLSSYGDSFTLVVSSKNDGREENYQNATSNKHGESTVSNNNTTASSSTEDASGHTDIVDTSEAVDVDEDSSTKTENKANRTTTSDGTKTASTSKSTSTVSTPVGSSTDSDTASKVETDNRNNNRNEEQQAVEKESTPNKTTEESVKPQAKQSIPQDVKQTNDGVSTVDTATNPTSSTTSSTNTSNVNENVDASNDTKETEVNETTTPNVETQDISKPKTGNTTTSRNENTTSKAPSTATNVSAAGAGLASLGAGTMIGNPVSQASAFANSQTSTENYSTTPSTNNSDNLNEPSSNPQKGYAQGTEENTNNSHTTTQDLGTPSVPSTKVPSINRSDLLLQSTTAEFAENFSKLSVEEQLDMLKNTNILFFEKVLDLDLDPRVRALLNAKLLDNIGLLSTYSATGLQTSSTHKGSMIHYTPFINYLFSNEQLVTKISDSDFIRMIFMCDYSNRKNLVNNSTFMTEFENRIMDGHSMFEVLDFIEGGYNLSYANTDFILSKMLPPNLSTKLLNDNIMTRVNSPLIQDYSSKIRRSQSLILYSLMENDNFGEKGKNLLNSLISNNGTKDFNFQLLNETIINDFGENFIIDIGNYFDLSSMLVSLYEHQPNLYSFYKGLIDLYKEDTSLNSFYLKSKLALEFVFNNQSVLSNIDLSSVDLNAITEYILTEKNFNVGDFSNDYREHFFETCDSDFANPKILSDLKNIYFQKFFSMNAVQAQSFITTFGNHLDEISSLLNDVDGINLKTAIDYLKYVMNLDNVEDLATLYDSQEFTLTFEEMLHLEEIGRRKYQESYTTAFAETKSNIENARDVTTIKINGREVRVIEMSRNFAMLVHSNDSGYKDGKDMSQGYIASWNSIDSNKTHGLSTSYLTQDNIGSVSVQNNGVLYGFYDLGANDIFAMGPFDIDSNIADYGYSTHGQQEFISADNMSLYTMRIYNEFVISRKNAKPSCVIIYDDSSETAVTSAYKAAAEWDIPVVRINKTNLATNQMARINSLIENYKETQNFESLRQALYLYEAGTTGFKMNVIDGSAVKGDGYFSSSTNEEVNSIFSPTSIINFLDNEISAIKESNDIEKANQLLRILESIKERYDVTNLVKANEIEKTASLLNIDSHIDTLNNLIESMENNEVSTESLDISSLERLDTSKESQTTVSDSEASLERLENDNTESMADEWDYSWEEDFDSNFEEESTETQESKWESIINQIDNDLLLITDSSVATNEFIESHPDYYCQTIIKLLQKGIDLESEGRRYRARGLNSVEKLSQDFIKDNPELYLKLFEFIIDSIGESRIESMNLSIFDYSPDETLSLIKKALHKSNNKFFVRDYLNQLSGKTEMSVDRLRTLLDLEEHFNPPSNQLLQLKDASEKMHPNSGGTNKKCFVFDDVVLLVGSAQVDSQEGYYHQKEIIESLIESGVSIALPIEYTRIDGVDYEIQERAHGSELYEHDWIYGKSDESIKEYINRLHQIAEEDITFFEKYVRDWNSIIESGLIIDPSKLGNFFYEHGKAITFIDLSIQEDNSTLDTSLEKQYLELSTILIGYKINEKQGFDEIRTIYQKLGTAIINIGGDIDTFISVVDPDNQYDLSNYFDSLEEMTDSKTLPSIADIKRVAPLEEVEIIPVVQDYAILERLNNNDIDGTSIIPFFQEMFNSTRANTNMKNGEYAGIGGCIAIGPDSMLVRYNSEGIDSKGESYERTLEEMESELYGQDLVPESGKIAYEKSKVGLEEHQNTIEIQMLNNSFSKLFAISIEDGKKVTRYQLQALIEVLQELKKSNVSLTSFGFTGINEEIIVQTPDLLIQYLTNTLQKNSESEIITLNSEEIINELISIKEQEQISSLDRLDSNEEIDDNELREFLEDFLKNPNKTPLMGIPDKVIEFLELAADDPTIEVPSDMPDAVIEFMETYPERRKEYLVGKLEDGIRQFKNTISACRDSLSLGPYSDNDFHDFVTKVFEANGDYETVKNIFLEAIGGDSSVLSSIGDNQDVNYYVRRLLFEYDPDILYRSASEQIDVYQFDASIDLFDNGIYGGNQSDVYELVRTTLNDSTNSAISSMKGQLLLSLVDRYFPNADSLLKLKLANHYAHGGCGYMAQANNFIAMMSNMENAEAIFKNRFGFDMYITDENGRKSYNVEALAFDIYLHRYSREYNGTPPNEMFRHTAGTNISNQCYKNYFASKGFLYKVKEETTIYDDFTQSASSFQFLNFILENPDAQYIISAGGIRMNSVYNQNRYISRLGSHAMSLTNVSSDGNFYVSSWNGLWKIFIEQTVDPSLMTSEEGNLYSPYFTLSAVQYEMIDDIPLTSVQLDNNEIFDYTKYDNESMYSLQSIRENNTYFKAMEKLLFDLVVTNEQRLTLEDILYRGKYDNYQTLNVMSNPNSVGSYRIAMANLFLNNPETFQYLFNNHLNLFHGAPADSNKLISILNKGLLSTSKFEENGIPMKKSIFPILDQAISLSTDIDQTKEFSFSNNNDQFPIIICTNADLFNVYPDRNYQLSARIEGEIPVDNIGALLVPEDKVDYVKSLVGDRNIQVLAMNFDSFYSYEFDNYGRTYNVAKYEVLKNKLKGNTGTNNNMTSIESPSLDNSTNIVKDIVRSKLSEEGVAPVERELLEKALDLDDNISQLTLARFLYYELGRKLDYDESMKYAAAYDINEFERLYNQHLTFADLTDSNRIICVSWAQLYSQLLIDVGFRPEQIVIQRITSNGEFYPNSHAGIYVLLDDGSIIMPDLTAPIGGLDDTYNVKINNDTQGFVLFTPEQIQEILQAHRRELSESMSDEEVKILNTTDITTLVQVMKQYESYTNSNFTIENRNVNESINDSITSDYDEFLDTVGQFLFAIAAQPKGTDGRLRLEELFYRSILDENAPVIAQADHPIEHYKQNISDFIERAIYENLQVEETQELYRNMIQTDNITSYFLRLDALHNDDMITVRNYINQLIKAMDLDNPANGTYISMGKGIQVPLPDGSVRNITIKLQFTKDGGIIPFSICRDGKVVSEYTIRAINGKISVLKSSDLYRSVFESLTNRGLPSEHRTILESITPNMTEVEIKQIPQKLLSSGQIKGKYEILINNNRVEILSVLDDDTDLESFEEPTIIRNLES